MPLAGDGGGVACPAGRVQPWLGGAPPGQGSHVVGPGLSPPGQAHPEAGVGPRDSLAVPSSRLEDRSSTPTPCPPPSRGEATPGPRNRWPRGNARGVGSLTDTSRSPVVCPWRGGACPRPWRVCVCLTAVLKGSLLPREGPPSCALPGEGSWRVNTCSPQAVGVDLGGFLLRPCLSAEGGGRGCAVLGGSSHKFRFTTLQLFLCKRHSPGSVPHPPCP